MRIFAARAVCQIGDGRAHRGEITHDPAVANDFCITTDVGGAGRVQRQRTDIGLAADFGQFAAALQTLRHRQRIGRLVMLDQLGDVLENRTVIAAVKIRFGDHIADAIPGHVVEQQPAQHRLLRLDRMRRRARGFELRILGERGDDLDHGGYLYVIVFN